MTLTSFSFFVFLIALFLLYYSLKKWQKYILLAGSVFFYFTISAGDIDNWWKTALLLMYIVGVTYFGAITIERVSEKRKPLLAGLFVSALAVVLVLFKYLYNIVSEFSSLLSINAEFSVLKFFEAIGISYFVLCAIGYLIEVSWGLYPAERNLGNLALFVLYFPQIISGPITRYAEMKKQFTVIHPLDYDTVTKGIRRMLWGYYKKLVISNSFALIVSAVFPNYHNFSGLTVLFAVLCYAVQLYTDFSGCMDIVIGASYIFGIILPENFKVPFLSLTIQEFWQRWHITLGVWFRDFVMYPLQKSKPMVNIGKKAKLYFGKRAGKKIPFYLSMMVMWTLLGIWHGGTAYYFVASAVVPFVLLTLSDLSSPLLLKLGNTLKINKYPSFWTWIKRARTILLICICWIFVCSLSVLEGFEALGYIFGSFMTGENVISTLKIAGFGIRKIAILAFSLIPLVFIEYSLFKGKTLYEFADKRKFFVRLLIIYVEIGCILLFNNFASEFIYFKF